MRTIKIYKSGRHKIALAIFMAFIACSSCKKDKYQLPGRNNEFKATVILSSGASIKINAKGIKAQMGDYFFGGGTFVNGTNEENQAVHTNSAATTQQYITSPGTYPFNCFYFSDVTSMYGSIYLNIGSNPGSITFTTINGNHMEGYFNAVCYNGADSAIVTGSFKGDF